MKNINQTIADELNRKVLERKEELESMCNDEQGVYEIVQEIVQDILSDNDVEVSDEDEYEIVDTLLQKHSVGEYDVVGRDIAQMEWDEKVEEVRNKISNYIDIHPDAEPEDIVDEIESLVDEYLVSEFDDESEWENQIENMCSDFEYEDELTKAWEYKRYGIDDEDED